MLGGGGVPVDQVGVGWVCAIVNGAVVSWPKKCALYPCIAWVNWVDTNFKVSVCVIYGERYVILTSWS